ncbi:MAG TPA: DUF1707 domain-containing protein [Natronosporangium sp.]
MAEQVRVRASDAERERVVARLRDAIGEGRLTLSEGEERIAGAYAATYRDELPAFTTDLPRPESPRPGTAGRSRRRPTGPPVGVMVLLAVATGVWALAGGPIWPAVVFSIFMIMMAKSGTGCQRSRARQTAQ